MLVRNAQLGGWGFVVAIDKVLQSRVVMSCRGEGGDRNIWGAETGRGKGGGVGWGNG